MHAKAGSAVIIAGLFLGLSSQTERVMAWERGRWEIARQGYVPSAAFRPGVHGNEGEQFVCAADNAVGKLVPSHSTCYIPYGGKEVGIQRYLVLVGSNYTWELLTGGVPHNAVYGASDNGEPVYICRRTDRSGGNSLGKYVASHDTCYQAYGGREYAWKTGISILVKN